MNTEESRGRYLFERMRVFFSRARYAGVDCVLHIARGSVALGSNRWALAALATVLLIGAGVAWLPSLQSDRQTLRHFSSVYSFVPETISKSAPVVLTLPEGIDAPDARHYITFDPTIEGIWVASERAQTLVYQPSEPLMVERYYAVALESPSVQLSADFKAVEDPVLDAVFPAADTEADEYSSITLVFNRPMVPLTTLAELESAEIPITVTPPTPGRFKWNSTRTLQFVPETRLQRASTYTIELGAGMTSVEGVPVPPKTHTFKTRPLRAEHMTQGELRYNRPVVLRFNQPVDLAATRRHIAVARVEGSARTAVPFEVTYGTRRVFNDTTREHDEVEDVSQVWIYQARDKNGRSLLWDFEHRYVVTLTDAVPLEGEWRSISRVERSIAVLDGIVNVSARSERSDNVEPALFDPQGELVVTFVEDIDLDRSRINAKALAGVRYDETCVRNEAGRIVYDEPGECRTEDVLDTVVLTFDETRLTRGETVTVSFERIVNTDRQTMNARPMTRSFTTYPELQILRTNPAQGTQAGSLTELVICTNSPLQTYSRDTYQDALSASRYLAFGSWNRPYRVSGTHSICASGTYQNTIRYGLHPEEPYTLALSLKDHFGQKVAHSLSFTSEKPKEEYVRFHNLQKVYNVTPPDRTRLTYAAENMEYMDMVICKMSARNLLERAHGSSQPVGSLAPESCLQRVTDRIELPKRYWVNNYFQVSLADYFENTKGHYSITFTHPLMVRDRWNNEARRYDKVRYYDRTFVSVTDMSVAEKRVNLSSYLPPRYSQASGTAQSDGSSNQSLQALLDARRDLYWVTRIGTLAPVAGATVTTYTRPNTSSGVVSAGRSGTTGWDGVVEIPSTERVVGAIVESGGESAVVAEWSDRLNYAHAARQHEHTYIYTDRPIYRPGHTVHIKGIDRIGYDGGHIIVEELTATAVIYSSRNEKVFERDIVLNSYGTFSFDFTLPIDASLGVYRIEVLGQSGRFDVQEYVPAAFKLDLTSVEDEYIAGDTMQIDLNAEYYFGVPVADAEVTYSVSSQDFFFDRFTDEHFSFGSGWYYCYFCSYNDAFLFRGSVRTDADGKARIERTLDFAELYGAPDEESSKIIVVSATVQDPAGRSVSGQSSFILHKGELYVGVTSDPRYGGTGTQFALRTKTVDTEGEPIAKRNIELVLEKIEWNTFRRREVDGGYYYHSEEQRTEVHRRTVATDRNGNASMPFTFTDSGRYELSARTEDARGNRLSAKSNLYIYGEGTMSVRPTNNHTLEMESEWMDVEIGDVPRIVVQSPYPRAKALITIERGSVYEYQIVDVTGGLFDHPIPIKESYSPNIFVNVLLVSPDPEVKQGQLEFRVSPNLKRLLISLATNKETYLPGEEVRVSLSTKTNDGAPIPAEVSLAVADLSVLALRGNPKKDPLRYFYPGLPHSVVTSSNLRHILYERDIPDGTKGGDGADPDDLAKRQRGIFRDTAFWSAHVETNTVGEAEVAFTLPDNLTTWQIEAVGVTRDTRVGAAYKEFMARKNLMAVPLRPRFVVPGDEFSIGATVYNQTERTQTFTIGLTSPTLEFLEEARGSIRLGAGEQRIVRFKVRAPMSMTAGAHTFTFSAENEDYADIVEQSIAITSNDTYEVVASAHMTKEDRAREFVYVPEEVIAGKGGITISTNATLALFTTEALEYLREYPYGCSEQLSSKLGGIAVSSRAAALLGNELPDDEMPRVYFSGAYYHPDEAVRLGLERLYENQVAGGGFAYYPQLRANIHLTIHVLDTLVRLRDAGYDVDERRLAQASAFVQQALAVPASLFAATGPDLETHNTRLSRATYVYAAYVLTRVGVGAAGYSSEIVNRMTLLAQNEQFLQEIASPITLAYLAHITQDGGYARADRERVYRAFESRLSLDGRGASIVTRPGAPRLWQMYETPIKNTALFLQVLARSEREHPMTDNILRWLLQSRSKDGAWGSTQNTLIAVEAFTDYVAWQREAEADYELSITVGDEEVARESFESGNLFMSRTTVLPIDRFARNTLETISFERTRRSGPETNLYYDMVFKYYLPIHLIPPRDEGIAVERAYYAREDTEYAEPRAEAKVGEVLKGRLVLTVPRQYTVVSVEDFIPAGFELVNFSLATEDQTLRDDPLDWSDSHGDAGSSVPHRIVGPFSRIGNLATSFFGLGSRASAGLEAYDTRIASRATRTRMLSVDFEEMRDDRVFLFSERLSPGVYIYEYYVRATTPGTFQHLPATASQMYFPEIFGRTEGNLFTVIE